MAATKAAVAAAKEAVDQEALQRQRQALMEYLAAVETKTQEDRAALQWGTTALNEEGFRQVFLKAFAAGAAAFEEHVFEGEDGGEQALMDQLFAAELAAMEMEAGAGEGAVGAVADAVAAAHVRVTTYVGEAASYAEAIARCLGEMEQEDTAAAAAATASSGGEGMEVEAAAAGGAAEGEE